MYIFSICLTVLNIITLHFIHWLWVVTICCSCCSVAKSCPTLCDPVDCSSPGSPVREISQAKIPECVVIPSPGDLPDPCLLHWQVDLLLLNHQGSPVTIWGYTCRLFCWLDTKEYNCWVTEIVRNSSDSSLASFLLFHHNRGGWLCSGAKPASNSSSCWACAGCF